MADDFAAELKAFRAEHGLTQADLGELMGYRADSIGKVEREAKPPTGPMRKKFRTARRRVEEAKASQGATASDPGEEEAVAAAAAGGDLPPLPEPPEPPLVEDEEEDGLVTLAKGGRQVKVRQLGHFQKIELSLLVFLVGKDIEYLAPAGGGKVETRSVHQMGLADLVPPADGAVLKENGPEIASAWAEWAKTSPRVNTFLSFLIVEGGGKGVAVVMGKTLLRIAQNHGFDPISFFMAPLRDKHLAAFGAAPSQSQEPYVEPHPADDLQAHFNGNGGGAEILDLGGGYGFRNVEGGIET